MGSFLRDDKGLQRACGRLFINIIHIFLISVVKDNAMLSIYFRKQGLKTAGLDENVFGRRLPLPLGPVGKYQYLFLSAVAVGIRFKSHSDFHQTEVFVRL